MCYRVPAFFLIFVSGAALADLSADVRCRELAFSHSAENRDLDAFTTFLDGDARFVSGTVLHGPEQIVAAWQVFFAEDGPLLKWRPRFVEVLDSGDIALTRGPYRLTSKTANGQSVEEWGTFNSIWRADASGEWRIIFDAGSPAAEPPDEQTRALLDAEFDCLPDQRHLPSSTTDTPATRRSASD